MSAYTRKRKKQKVRKVKESTTMAALYKLSENPCEALCTWTPKRFMRYVTICHKMYHAKGEIDKFISHVQDSQRFEWSKLTIDNVKDQMKQILTHPTRFYDDMWTGFNYWTPEELWELVEFFTSCSDSSCASIMHWVHSNNIYKLRHPDVKHVMDLARIRSVMDT